MDHRLHHHPVLSPYFALHHGCIPIESPTNQYTVRKSSRTHQDMYRENSTPLKSKKQNFCAYIIITDPCLVKIINYEVTCIQVCRKQRSLGYSVSCMTRYSHIKKYHNFIKQRRFQVWFLLPIPSEKLPNRFQPVGVWPDQSALWLVITAHCASNRKSWTVWFALNMTDRYLVQSLSVVFKGPPFSTCFLWALSKMDTTIITVVISCCSLTTTCSALTCCLRWNHLH